jgi:hypothetical protein
MISGAGLRVLSLKDLGTLPVRSENVTDAAWMADGTRVALLKNLMASAPSASQPNAFLLDLESGREIPLAALSSALNRDWRNVTGHPTFYDLTTAQNVAAVAVIENSDGGALIVDLRSGQARHVDLAGRCRHDLNRSADAGQLAYLTCDSRTRWLGMRMDQLRVVDLSIGEDEVVVRVTNEDAWIADVSWWTEPPVIPGQ